MGLIYQKKNDEKGNDGKTVLFTDFFTAPPVNDQEGEEQKQEEDNQPENNNKTDNK